MAPIVTTAKLLCRSREARDKVLRAFHSIAEFARANEPGVTRYVVSLPEIDTGTEIYMIEEYSNTAAQKAHMESIPVQELLHLFATEDLLLSPPEVYNNGILAERSSPFLISATSNPAIVISTHTYSRKLTSEHLQGWTDLSQTANAAKNGAKAFTVLGTLGGNDIITMEVYESFDAWDEPHKGSGLKELESGWGVGERSTRTDCLRAVDGFWEKGKFNAKF